MATGVGYAWICEKSVIYGSVQDFLTMARAKPFSRKHGALMGVIITEIPIDPYYVLYEYLKQDPKFIKRISEKRHWRKLRVTRRSLKHQRTLEGKRLYDRYGRRRRVK